MNKVAAVIGLLAGIALMLYWGGEAPPWLRNLECLVVMLAALFFGFTAYNPAMPAWVRHDAVKGVALVYLGVGAAFVPANLLLSALLIGSGCKLVMQSTSHITARVLGGKLAHSSTEIVVREEAGISRL